MRALNQGKNSQAMLAPSPLAPTLGRGEPKSIEFPKDGEYYHSVLQCPIGDTGEDSAIREVCDARQTIHVAAFRKRLD
jgi:hypothetical protein